MHRLIDSTNKLRNLWHQTNDTLDMKQDILWWFNFMEIINGTMPMIDLSGAISSVYRRLQNCCRAISPR